MVAVAGATEDAGEEAPAEPPEVPAQLGLPAVALPVGPSPAGDRGSLRLVARHTLWDAGTLVQSLPALAGLHPAPRLVLHPAALAELGAADGEAVRVTSARGSLVIAATGDFAIPRGTAVVPWNLPGAHAGDLIDAAAPFTDVSIETVGLEGGETGG
jgi:anaerobic selenocysteine-containing dehydrogenase